MYLSIEGFTAVSVDRISSITCSSGTPGTGDIIFQSKPMECFGEVCHCITIQFRDGWMDDQWIVEFGTEKERDKVFAEMIDDLAAGKQVLRIPATARVR